MAAAGQLGDVFSAYAQTRVQQAFHEIDATVEAYKANALIDMGLTSQEVTEQEKVANITTRKTFRLP